MDYSVTAKQILEHMGGEKNVASVTHCMTRLRFVLKDESGIDDGKVKAIPGVVGVMRKAGQYQIIIGNNVAKCYQELTKLGSFQDTTESAAGKKGKQNIFMKVLDVISGCMAPVIPAIIGAGMIRVLIIILGYFLSAESQTMQLMTVIGDSAFYFLPILVAYSAARKFNANPVLVASVVAVLIHPDFITLINGGDKVRFLGIPVTVATYSSTIIPSILTAWVMSYIERLVDKITPAFTKNFLKPALILLISAPVAFLLLGPLGSLIGNGLAAVLVAIQTHASVVAYIIMAAAMPFIVMTGMHWAFIPVVFAALDTPAGEALMLPAMLISNLAQGASCFAVAVKSKDSKLRQMGASSGVSALFAGVTEPGLYGVTMPLKRPLIALCAASGITGLIAGIMNVTAQSFASPSLLSLPIFVSAEKSGNLMMAVIISIIAIVLSFVLTWIMGFEDPASTTEKEDSSAQTSARSQSGRTDESCMIGAPIAGEAVSLSQVNDETFSTGVLGKGVAILPAEGKVYAPFDGKVETLPDSFHALGLSADNGVGLLIHVGLETVGLKGKHFKPHVKEGQTIKKGDLLLEFDLAAIAAAGFDTVTPVIVTNADDYADVIAENISKETGKTVKVQDDVIRID